MACSDNADNGIICFIIIGKSRKKRDIPKPHEADPMTVSQGKYKMEVEMD